MLKKIRAFKEERNHLNILKLQDDHGQERTLKLIKNEVIDIADKFDRTNINIESQLAFIVKML
jgi:hypothetical protein